MQGMFRGRASGFEPQSELCCFSPASDWAPNPCYVPSPPLSLRVPPHPFVPYWPTRVSHLVHGYTTSYCMNLVHPNAGSFTYNNKKGSRGSTPSQRTNQPTVSPCPGGVPWAGVGQRWYRAYRGYRGLDIPGAGTLYTCPEERRPGSNPSLESGRTEQAQEGLHKARRLRGECIERKAQGKTSKETKAKGGSGCRCKEKIQVGVSADFLPKSAPNLHQSAPICTNLHQSAPICHNG